MNSTPTEQQVETEFKFRVPADFELPSFPRSLGTWTTEATRNMDATYWDTTDATLLRWGITMRTRSGGGDDGSGGDVTCQDWNDTHLNHDTAGRAYYSGGYYTTGGNDYLGAVSGTYSWVKETDSGVFEAGQCN